MTARILVVDDIEANVRLLQAKLSAEYYDVLTASDGATALASAAADQPDLILLDVMMPGLRGDGGSGVGALPGVRVPPGDRGPGAGPAEHRPHGLRRLLRLG